MLWSISCLIYLLIAVSGCTYSGNHWGEWSDSQLQPTIQKLMKGYNRYLRPNFNGRDERDCLIYLSLIVSIWMLVYPRKKSLMIFNSCVSVFDRGSCGNWNESRHRQHWCHLWNQHGTSLFILIFVSKWMKIWMNKYSLHIFLGLHCNHLPPSALAWLPPGVPREWERQRGRAPRVPAVDPWHLHPRLQALLPAWRHSGKPPHPHLQQRDRSLCPTVQV